jgi:hypothetical protein
MADNIKNAEDIIENLESPTKPTRTEDVKLSIIAGSPFILPSQVTLRQMRQAEVN